MFSRPEITTPPLPLSRRMFVNKKIVTPHIIPVAKPNAFLLSSMLLSPVRYLLQLYLLFLPKKFVNLKTIGEIK